MLIINLISDLHIHGKYAMACSKDIDFKNLEKYANMKGVQLLGTGDFTHPKWINEIKKNLSEKDGILFSKSGFPFVLQTEIALYYKQEKGRRIHHLVLAPSLEVVDQITEGLLKKGRVDYDGRPVFGMSSIEFVDLLKNISKDIEIIPAHIWTSWMSILGSKSGFDSVEECFEEKSKHIHALETGLSSDPEMNQLVSKLDKYSLVSFSDMHSYWPWRIGREATIFNMKKLNYKSLIESIRKNKIVETLEFYPEEGKYHLDGHRKCSVSMEREQTLKNSNNCTKCGKPVVIGVLNRVKELADREKSVKHKNSKPFTSLIPLSELIAHELGCGVSTKKVWDRYNKIIEKFGNELDIIFKTPEKDLEFLGKRLSNLIIKSRNKKMKIEPGYDGLYGKIIS